MSARSPSVVRVLAVDDDQSFVELTARRLELELDYDEVAVVTETDAETALDRATDDIDCIVSDYQMPGMDGLEFLAAVREHRPEIPFVLFTGKGSEEIASDAISAGVTDYVQKRPGSDQYLVLATRIETVVDAHHARQARGAVEQRYAHLVEQSPHAIAVCRDAEICHANHAFTDLLKADAREDVVGLALTDVLEPECRDGYMRNVERIKNDEPVGGFEAEVRDFDGESRLVETTGAPVPYDGDPAVQLILRDTTERARREHDLEPTTEPFRTVFEHSHDPMLVLDPETTSVHDANPRASELLRYSRDELLALTLEDICPHQSDQLGTVVESVASGERASTRDLCCQTANGSTVPVELSASVVEAGGHERILAVLRDPNAREIREPQARQLREAATALSAADSRSEVGRIAVDAAQAALDRPYSGFYLLDPETESLEPVVCSPGVDGLSAGDVPSFRAGDDSLAWSTYTDGQTRIIQNLETAGAALADGMPVESGIQLPVGDRGLLFIAAPTTNAFDPAEVAVARLLATSVDASMTRIAREEELALKSQAIDEADIGLTISDPTRPENPLIYANEGFEQLTGYAETEVLGENCRFLQGTETDPETVDTMRQAIHAEDPVTVEVLNYRKDGTRFWNQLTISPVRDADGSATHFLGLQRDVTDRKEYEREVELLRDLLDQSTDEVYVVARGTGRFVEVNDTICQHLGYDRDELLEMSVQDVDASGFSHQWDRWIDQSGADGPAGAGVFYERHERTDGTTYPTEVSADHATVDGDEYLLAVARDLSDRQERERRIQEQQRRLDTILSNVTVALWEIDGDGVFTKSDGQALQALGLEPGEVVGSSVSEVHADHPEILDHCERALDGESIATTVDVGDAIFESWYEPLCDDDGTVTGVVGLAYDITARKQQEHELRRLKERFQQVFEQSNDAIVVVDTDGEEFVEVNRAACEMLEYTREELLAVNPRDIHPAGADRAREEFLTAVSDTGSGWTDELPCVTKHGEEILTEISGATLRIDETRDHPPKMVAILRDVSTRVAYERELERQKQALERQKQALERQNERLDNFASIVSHDLRNPLTLAEGYLKLLRETGDETVIDDMGRAHDRMRTIINDVLTVARDGQTVEEPDLVEFPALVRAAWDGVETGNATLNTEELPGGVLGDENRLQRVFENLFRNAIEHAGENVAVTVGCLPDEQGVYIADDGPGIPEEKREDVFDWGYSTVEDGTGYGLAIVNDLIEAHGWTVTVTRSEPDGCRFEILGIEPQDTAAEHNLPFQ